MESRKERESNFELLRIVAIFAIIMFHFSEHGMVNIYVAPLSLNRLILEFFQIGGGFGNCLFALLSGYFLCISKFDIKKIIKLYIQILFYSVLLGCLSMILGFIPINKDYFIKIFFPITKNQYWWFSIYFILYIISPYLNKLINVFKKREFSNLIFVGFIILSILPTFFKCEIWYSNLLFFIFLYLVGSYIKK